MREKGNSFTMKSEEFIGRGGNAFVADCGNGCVKKILNIKKCNREKIQRFKDEVTVMKRLNGTKGVLPILQDHLDDGKHEYWYTMPKAELLIEHINKSDNKYQECQKAIQQLILTLSCLHEKKISHRDIKPSNLYYYDGLYCFGDFGLVDFPDKFNELTKSYKQLGAWTTIAPEMKRNPKNADGIKADVYSFAKTIWIVLTGNDKCFDGTYDYLDELISLRYTAKCKGKYYVDIERLLYKATNNDPNERPTTKELKEYIDIWIKKSKNSELSQQEGWDFLKELIFGSFAPKSAMWEDNNSIIRVLNIISSFDVLNHCLFSSGGGMDFDKAELSTEEGFIDLIMMGYSNRVKPKSLYFESFKYCTFNYFKLDLENVTEIFNTIDLDYEELCEDKPGNYVDAKDFVYGVYDYDSEEKLPNSARKIYRFTRGSLLFVMKIGAINSIFDYSGRYVKLSNEELKLVMNNLVCLYDEAINVGQKPIDYVEFFFNRYYNKRYNDNAFVNIQCKEDGREYCNFVINEIFKIKFEIKSSIDLGNCKMGYYLEFQCESKDIMNYCPERVLFKNGYITEFDKQKANYNNVAMLDSLERAKDYKAEFQKYIDELVNIKGLKIPDFEKYFFEIRIIKGGAKPNYLFSKEDVVNLMRNADDRERNQLVVGCDGHVNNLCGKLLKDSYYYPVRVESWDARKNCLGKYSKLEDANECYERLLFGWLRWLKLGYSIYSDYIPNDFEIGKVINEIYKFY